jgi:hypothetical protein
MSPYTFFEEIHVQPKYPSTVLVQWQLNNQALPENYYFYVWLSGHPDKEFKKINTAPVINQYFFEFPYQLLVAEEYLFVKIEAVIGPINTWSKPQGLFYNLPRRSFLNMKEIIRKKELLRRKFVGVECDVYKKRVWGAPCPDCIDIHTGLATNSKCLKCFGTGKLGGYYAPVTNWVEIVEGPREIKPSELGTLSPRFANGMLTYPMIQKGDIIVERKRNRRWYIGRIEREAYQTFPIDQTAELRLISPKDIEYRLGAE